MVPLAQGGIVGERVWSLTDNNTLHRKPCRTAPAARRLIVETALGPRNARTHKYVRDSSAKDEQNPGNIAVPPHRKPPFSTLKTVQFDFAVYFR